MSRYGCIGKKLTHSFSGEIHARLADYRYELIELSEEELPSFLEQKAFASLNVTMPYKQTVIPFLDEISDEARRIGAVNTIVNRGGKLYGYNTDYHGMKALTIRIGADLRGKKVLVLGTGGTSKTAGVLAADLGAAQVVTVSRRASDGYVTYEQASTLHADAQILINTTPCGMYPDVDGAPMDLAPFGRLEGVIDAVYNPLRTNLILDAKARGIRAEGGLYMLVMQAVAAVEKFLGTPVDSAVADRVFADLLAAKENIVLIGMPGSGKSTVGKLLRSDGFAFFDTDEEVEKRCGCTIKALIAAKGEAYFRDVESAVIRDVSAESGRVIATGGGAVLRAENLRNLKRNGRLFFLDAPLSRLQATEDRPLSDTADKLAKLYAERIAIYLAAADTVVPALTTPAEEAAYILSKRKE
ncbi:MAG: shikimate dehydrogenase [Clostridia bacterium]|nr:shikimate dehydrogenase [Clostridia bacterium]